MEKHISALLIELHTALSLDTDANYWSKFTAGSRNGPCEFAGVIDDSVVGQYYTKKSLSQFGVDVPLKTLDFVPQEVGDLWQEIADQLNQHPMLQSQSTFCAEDFMQGCDRVLFFIGDQFSGLQASDKAFALSFMQALRLEKDMSRNLVNTVAPRQALDLQVLYEEITLQQKEHILKTFAPDWDATHAPPQLGENLKKVTLQISLHPSVLMRLLKEAETRQLSLDDLIEEILMQADELEALKV